MSTPHSHDPAESELVAPAPEDARAPSPPEQRSSGSGPRWVLALGVLGLAAVLTKQELLLVIVGGVFVAETLSVMAQVASFKLTGRRLLRCAPLHHHYEFQGWKETRIVGRFHAAALALAALGVVGALSV